MRAVQRIFAVFCSIALLPMAAAAQGGADKDQRGAEFTCPVGGETFRQDVEMMFYPLEGLPNGSSFGGQLSDRMVPVCPGNGLALAPAYDGNEGDPEAFTDYTPEEIAKLPALIASAEYTAIAGEAAYLRLYWLATKLGRPALQRFHLLQHVSWVGATPEQHRANLERFVSLGEGLISAPDFDPERRWKARYFVANALRELGRFDEAKAKLDGLQADWEVEWAKLAAANPANPHFEEDGEGQDYFSGSILSLLDAIAERDNDYHPVSMMGDKVANSTCGNLDDSFPPATENTKRGCAKRKADQARWQTDWQDGRSLRVDPAALAAQCKTFPVEQREEILANACDTAEYWVKYQERQAEAKRLLKSPKALDLRCKGVNIPDRYSRAKTALGEACLKRRDIVLEADTTALAAKLREQPSEYDRLCTREYPDMHSMNPVELACERVQNERNDALANKELTRLAKMSEADIWTECERTNGGRDAKGFTLSFRCSDIKFKREDAQWKALEAEPEKLAATCAKPYDEREEWLQLKCSFYNDDRKRDAAMELAKDHSKLVTACAATPVPQRDAILQRSCNSFRRCVVVRADELPFSEASVAHMLEAPDPSALSTACYASVEKADAAYARYRADPKSLRASCKPETELAEEPYDPELCARYARGEDVFAEISSEYSDRDIIAPPPVISRPLKPIKD